jgi:hypothetical protein
MAFTDGGTVISGCGTVAVNTTTGKATCSFTYNAAGGHSIIGTYSGDANFNGSTSSPALMQVVNGANTTTGLMSGTNPSLVGQSVTFTATVTVTAPGSGSPTGTVSFASNGTTIPGCSARPVSSGTATCTTSFASATTFSITATYSGDANFNTSTTSSALSQVVNKAGTTTTLASSANPSVVGQDVTYTATIHVTAPGGGSPTGTVDFTDNGTTIAGCGSQAVSAVTETATCDPAYAATGSHPIVASYSGDTNYNSSASSPALNQVVNKAATSTALQSSSNPSSVGQDVTYTATISVTAPGAGSPSGTVAFMDNGTPITGCTAQAVSTVTETATCDPIYGAVGNHPIVATYSGDANFTTSMSTTLTQVVGAVATATTVSVAPTSVASGDQVTYSATVTSGTGTPGGTVTFTIGNAMMCVAALSAGSGSCMSTAAPVGSDTVTGTYSGDATHTASAGMTQLTVTGACRVLPGSGYWMVGKDGGVFAFGGAPYLGSLPALGVHVENIVAIAPTADDCGYWLLGKDGGIFAFGDAPYLGSLPALGVHVENIVGFAPTPDGGGYWMAGADGGMFAFGDARYHGSLPGVGVHTENIVGMAAADAGGYWLVGMDGGVFAFGDAPYRGSLPGMGIHLENIVGLATPDAGGYWLTGADGSVFSFGDAAFHGSLPGIPVHVENVVGMASRNAGGYWLAGADGGVFNFGGAVFDGSVPGAGVAVQNVVAIAGD